MKKKIDIPDDLDEYDLIDGDVSFHCPKCKADVSKDDAMIVVSGCSIDRIKRQVVQTPSRAFHFNAFNGVTCMEDLEIKEKEQCQK